MSTQRSSRARRLPGCKLPDPFEPDEAAGELKLTAEEVRPGDLLLGTTSKRRWETPRQVMAVEWREDIRGKHVTNILIDMDGSWSPIVHGDSVRGLSEHAKRLSGVGHYDDYWFYVRRAP